MRNLKIHLVSARDPNYKTVCGWNVKGRTTVRSLEDVKEEYRCKQCWKHRAFAITMSPYAKVYAGNS